MILNDARLSDPPNMFALAEMHPDPADDLPPAAEPLPTGIHYCQPRARYNATNAVSQSFLKRMAPNPEAFRDGLPERDSEAMRWGRLVEAHLFSKMLPEQDRLPIQSSNESYAILTPEEKWRLLSLARDGQKQKNQPESREFTKNLGVYKLWAEEQKRLGREIVDWDDYKESWEASQKLRKHPLVSATLEAAQAQVALVWEDPITGLICKGLLDLLTDKAVIDLKTTADETKDGFAKSIRAFGYATQAAFYLAGLEALGQRREWGWIAQRNTKPYPIATWRLSDRDHWLGKQRCAEMLQLWLSIQETGHWPGASGEWDIIQAFSRFDS